MMTLRRAEERGQADHGWLKTAHTFSFADYHDPRHMGFGSLRVINDDVVAGGGGFPTHPHRDMEIITYVLSGALQHRDSMGTGAVIRPGTVQYMAAGSGIQHSEFNASPFEPVHLLQIWILPDQRGARPRYEQRDLPPGPDQGWVLVASKAGREGSIRINQDADMYVSRLAAGQSTQHALQAGRRAWLHVATGEITLNGTRLAAGDAAALTEENALAVKALQPSQVLLFDLN